jgi:iron complex transport system permease protein
VIAELPTIERTRERLANPAAAVRARRLRVLLGSGLALLGLCVVSLLVGSRGLAPSTVYNALLGRGTDGDVAIVRGLRLPRTLTGVAVGVALGMCGALLQGLTRNPLADPFILGISAGAAFAVVVASGLLGVTAAFGYVWFSFLGAAGATIAVYLIGGMGRGGATPTKIALAGAAMAALLGSFTTTVLLLDPLTLDQYRLWMVGSLQGRTLSTIGQIVPFLVVGVVVAMTVTPALNNLALGDDVARSLGLSIGSVRLRGVIAITLLAGGAVAAAGPIGFVALVVPHMARAICGPDQRWILALSALFGPCLLLTADILGRVLAHPGEVPVGVVAALIGAPAFIALVRRRKLSELR